MKQYRVFPECNVDTNFVGQLLGGAVMHKSTCNEVAKAVNNSDLFAVGIIDADKRQATLDPGFTEYVQDGKADGKTKHVTMYIHDDGKRFMFTIKPAMEKFIMDAAKDQKVDMRDAGYDNTLDGFKKETKRITAETDPKLRRLFVLIKDNPELSRFRNTLKYLMTALYGTDVEVAKQYFNGTLTEEDLEAFFKCNQSEL